MFAGCAECVVAHISPTTKGQRFANVLETRTKRVSSFQFPFWKRSRVETYSSTCPYSFFQHHHSRSAPTPPPPCSNHCDQKPTLSNFPQNRGRIGFDVGCSRLSAERSSRAQSAVSGSAASANVQQARTESANAQSPVWMRAAFSHKRHNGAAACAEFKKTQKRHEKKKKKKKKKRGRASRGDRRGAARASLQAQRKALL